MADAELRALAGFHASATAPSRRSGSWAYLGADSAVPSVCGVRGGAGGGAGMHADAQRSGRGFRLSRRVGHPENASRNQTKPIRASRGGFGPKASSEPSEAKSGNPACGSADDASSDVVEDVHEVDVRVVGRLVGVEVLVHVAVGEPLGAHVVEVVGGLQLAPVVDQDRRRRWPRRRRPARRGRAGRWTAWRCPARRERSRSVSAQEIMCGTSTSPTAG